MGAAPPSSSSSSSSAAPFTSPAGDGAGKKGLTHVQDYLTDPTLTDTITITGERIGVNILFVYTDLSPEDGDVDLYIRCPVIPVGGLNNADARWCSTALLYQARPNTIVLEDAPAGTYEVRDTTSSSSSSA